jgi:multidrug efflux pump subunit AcrB
MARAFIHSPLSPLLFIAMLAMGLIGLIATPRQEDPQISVPMIDVLVAFPGASAQQVSSLAIEPLERLMSEIPGVEHVYSASQRGQGIVTVQYFVGEDLEESIVKAHSKIKSNMDKMPPGVMPPLVKPKGIDDVPVVTLTLWSKHSDDGILRTLALDILQRLKEIPNTGEGYIIGGRAEQVKVAVRPERLSGFGVTLDQVAQTIRTANSEAKAGATENGGRHFTVYSGAFLRTAEDVANLVVATRQGSPVYVRDVALVTQEPEEARQVVTYSTGPRHATPDAAAGEAAVTIALAKKIGSNGVSVAEAILEKVRALQHELGVIPPDVRVEVTRNYGESARDKVNNLILKLFIATGAVTLLVWFALGFRPAAVVTAVIPVVILMTVFAALLGGFTIDRVSLFALIFSIGILVDDAIVVIENIYRRWLLAGETSTAVAVDAVREVGNPTILATFTVIAALLPMGFVSGMMGPYMRPIPVLGSVAMLISVLAAFIFTPWLAMRLKPSLKLLHAQEQKEHHEQERVARLFERTLVPLMRDKGKGRLFLAGLLLAFFAACGMFVVKWVKVKMLPLDNKPEFSVVLNLPAGTALPTTANLAAQVAQRIRNEIPHVVAVQTYAGTARPFDFNGMVRHYYLREAPWEAEVQVQLTHKNQRKESSHDLAMKARDLVREMVAPMNQQLRQQQPGIKGIRATVVEMPPGPPVLQSVVADVYGPDDATRRATARLLTRVFEETDGLADVDNYMSEPYPVWRFEVDTEKAVRRGVTVDAINRNIAMALGGQKLGDIKQGKVQEPTWIVVEVPLAERSQIGRLNDLPIPAGDGQHTVPLAELGRFVLGVQEDTIFHKDLRPVEYVVGDAVGELAAPIYPMLKVEARLKELETADGVRGMSGAMTGPPVDEGKSAFAWAGEWTVTYETFRDMGIAFAAALVLIYILVVWEFGNFVVPAIIMAPIPLTLLGIVPGHWFVGVIMGGGEFTATSMIGFIALAGIIVRNSILLVDFAIHELKAGKPLHEAVLNSCRTRTRPILITALALVAGSFVIITDAIFQGMAISLLFGVLVSSVLTLVVIPLGCISAGRYMCVTCPPELIGGSLPPGSGSAPSGTPPREPPLEGTGMVAKTGEYAMLGLYLIRAVFILAWEGIKAVAGRLRSPAAEATNQAPVPVAAVTAVAPASTPVAGPQPTAVGMNDAQSVPVVASAAKAHLDVDEQLTSAVMPQPGPTTSPPAVQPSPEPVSGAGTPRLRRQPAKAVRQAAKRSTAKPARAKPVRLVRQVAAEAASLQPASGAGAAPVVAPATKKNSRLPGGKSGKRRPLEASPAHNTPEGDQGKHVSTDEQPPPLPRAAKRGPARRGIRLNPNL